MKKVIFILLAILIMVGVAYAKEDTCLFVWNIDPGASTADAPDEVHCSIDGTAYVSKGATWAMSIPKGAMVTVTMDTVVADGSTTSADLVSSGSATAIPDNVNVQDVRFLGSANCSTFDAGGVFYYTYEDLAVDDTQTISLTPVSCLKVQLGTSTDTGAGGGVVWVKVSY